MSDQAWTIIDLTLYLIISFTVGYGIYSVWILLKFFWYLFFGVEEDEGSDTPDWTV